MLLCAAGDIYGALDRLYVDVLAFEVSLGARFDHLLHVGDFGIWPDPARVDRAGLEQERIVLDPRLPAAMDAVLAEFRR